MAYNPLAADCQTLTSTPHELDWHEVNVGNKDVHLLLFVPILIFAKEKGLFKVCASGWGACLQIGTQKCTHRIMVG